MRWFLTFLCTITGFCWADAKCGHLVGTFRETDSATKITIQGTNRDISVQIGKDPNGVSAACRQDKVVLKKVLFGQAGGGIQPPALPVAPGDKAAFDAFVQKVFDAGQALEYVLSSQIDFSEPQPGQYWMETNNDVRLRNMVTNEEKTFVSSAAQVLAKQ